MEKIYRSFEDLPLVLNVKTVAAVLGISVSGAYALFEREDFPTKHVGGRKLVTRDAFLEWLGNKE